MRRSALIAAVLATSLTTVACTSTSSRNRVAPRAEESDQEIESLEVESTAGRISCHDGTKDVLSEGSGDQSGPAPSPPEPAQRGTDLTGVSMSRYESGMTINFGAVGRIPTVLPKEARLYYLFTAIPLTPKDPVSEIRAAYRHNRWFIDVGQGDRYKPLDDRPEIAGNVLSMDIETDELPELMHKRFRWRTHSEWIPRPTDLASEVFLDFCPEHGFPIFKGMSS